jgi:hypothetical protein
VHLEFRRKPAHLLGNALGVHSAGRDDGDGAVVVREACEGQGVGGAGQRADGVAVAARRNGQGEQHRLEGAGRAGGL